MASSPTFGDEVKGILEEEKDSSLANSDVVTKYQEAAKIANAALEAVLTKAEPGSSPVELCKMGDNAIEERLSRMFVKKVKGRAVDKGVAFPTCVSVNECVCHNSPLNSEPQEPLKDGDIVKVDLGVHIDGFIAVAAHTAIVGKQPNEGEPLRGQTADVFTAAMTAAEVAAKLIKPGNTNQQVTDAVDRVAKAYGANAVQGTLMHQLKRYVADGNKVIILREEVDQKVDDVTFEQGEVYAVDVAFSTGEDLILEQDLVSVAQYIRFRFAAVCLCTGKPKESSTRTTVFKRAVDKSYYLKMKASRYVFNEMNHKYQTLPFTLRALDDEKQARMGVVECLKHELLHPYPILTEKPGDIIVHIKFTLLLLPSGSQKVTGLPYSASHMTSDKSLPEDIKSILATSSKAKKKKKKTGSSREDYADTEQPS